MLYFSPEVSIIVIGGELFASLGVFFFYGSTSKERRGDIVYATFFLSIFLPSLGTLGGKVLYIIRLS